MKDIIPQTSNYWQIIFKCSLRERKMVQNTGKIKKSLIEVLLAFMYVHTYVCMQVCRSSSELIRHTVIHRVIRHADPINLLYMPDPYEIECCLKSHLRGYGWLNKMEVIRSDVRGEAVAIIWVRCSNYHVYVWVHAQVHFLTMGQI